MIADHYVGKQDQEHWSLAGGEPRFVTSVQCMNMQYCAHGHSWVIAQVNRTVNWGESMKNHTSSVLLIALVWLSVLVIWAVRTVDNHLNHLQPQGAVGITGSPEGGFVVDQYVHAVPMGNNGIWIIDTSQHSVQVVTRGKDGTFHWSSPK